MLSLICASCPITSILGRFTLSPGVTLCCALLLLPLWVNDPVTFIQILAFESQ